MKYQPTISYSKKVMIFNLEKPIYGSYFGVWDKWLKIAKQNNFKLIIHTPVGTATYPSVKEFLQGAKRMERFFKNPKVPMIFYGKELLPDIKKREERKKLEKKIKESKGQVMISALQKMKEKQPELFENIKEKIISL